MTPAVQRARDFLTREPERVHATLFAILDAARAEAVPGRLAQVEAESVSLYRGEPEEVLAAVAPYLVKLEPQDEADELFGWITAEGWGDNWGIFLTSAEGLEDLRKHFRRFLMVKDEEGKQLYFRFYDPRVLRVYLPTCTSDELETFFGPITSFLLESDDGEKLLRYYLRDDRAVLESFTLTEAGDTPEVTVLEPAAASSATSSQAESAPSGRGGRVLRRRR